MSLIQRFHQIISLSIVLSEREAARVHPGLDPRGSAVAGCLHLSVCLHRRKTLLAQLSLRLLLREAGRHSCQIHPSGMEEGGENLGLTILKV